MIGSFSGVASRMPEWCDWKPAATNLQGWFCNPVIRGHIGHLLDKRSGKGWNQRWEEIKYDQHPALISEGDWRQLADMLRRPRNRFLGGGATDTQHGQTGLLRIMRSPAQAQQLQWRRLVAMPAPAMQGTRQREGSADPAGGRGCVRG